MARLDVLSSIRQPGLSRKLTLAFVLVIVVMSVSFPVAFVAFAQVSAASERAERSATTSEGIARFQRTLSDVRSLARDYAANSSKADADAMITSLNEASAIARCLADTDKCSGSNEHLSEGEVLPDGERDRWRQLLGAANDAGSTFKRSASANPAAAIEAFDRALATDVDEPAQELAGNVTARGVEAQDEIRTSILSSSAMLTAVLVGSVLLALLLAGIIPRRIMGRLFHLRAVSHRLATGDLSARADESRATRDDEIGDLLADFNLMAMALQTREQRLQTLQRQLEVQLEKEQERATRDPLTGLRNHRYFQESLRAEIERCRRTGGNVTIAVIDLDDFKQVNDRFGHSEGDAVLLRATKGISDNLRPYDLACRLGGEEFGIIFPEAEAAEAMAIMDRIAAHIVGFGPSGERLTFSGGLATFPLHANAQADLTHRADEAAYTAKMNGKAHSVIYDAATVTSMGSEDHLKQRSRDAMLTTATTLVQAVDEKDPYTRHHSELVGIYAATVARAMRLDERTVKLVYRAGLLHDVGKIGIDDDILLKGERLTHDEWVQLRMHPEFSYRILEAADMEPVATWTRHHHEHFDGTGYPMGLRGNDIPIGARIVLVADAFEAMTSDRVYRRALGVSHALEELRRGAGYQFDPAVVQVMVELVETGVFSQVMQQYGRTIEAPADAGEYAHGGQPSPLHPELPPEHSGAPEAPVADLAQPPPVPPADPAAAPLDPADPAAPAPAADVAPQPQPDVAAQPQQPHPAQPHPAQPHPAQPPAAAADDGTWVDAEGSWPTEGGHGWTGSDGDDVAA